MKVSDIKLTSVTSSNFLAKHLLLKVQVKVNNPFINIDQLSYLILSIFCDCYVKLLNADQILHMKMCYFDLLQHVICVIKKCCGGIK